MLSIIKHWGLITKMDLDKRVLEALREHSTDCIYVKNDKSQFEWVNDTLARRFKKHPSEVVGKTDFDYFLKEHAQQAFDNEQEIIRTGIPINLEEKETWPDGSETWASTTKWPLPDENGKIIGTFGISRDITHDKKLEQRAARAETLGAVGASVSKVSHDFNNKIGAILSIVELLEADESIKAGSQTYDLLQQLKCVAEQGISITNELLDFSRDKPYNFKVTKIEPIIKDSILLAKVQPAYKKIEIKTNFEQNTYEVEADVCQISRIMENLLSNAKDAMPNGGILSIEVKNITIDPVYAQSYPGAKEGEYVLISVNDTGIGMSKEILSKIFKEFYTTKGSKGNGLGLAISHTIAKKHSGFIDVYSEQGHGTTFKVYLPRSHKKSTIEQRLSSDITRGTESILVVDDEKPILDAAKLLLEKQGYKVLTAEDGQQALDLYKTTGIDLVLLDVTIPNVDSATVMKEIFSINPNAKIVLSSGYSRSNVAEDVLQKSIGYLQKPFLNNSLSQTVRTALDSKV